jgi:hypothetical protein
MRAASSARRAARLYQAARRAFARDARAGFTFSRRDRFVTGFFSISPPRAPIGASPDVSTRGNAHGRNPRRSSACAAAVAEQRGASSLRAWPGMRPKRATARALTARAPPRPPLAPQRVDCRVDCRLPATLSNEENPKNLTILGVRYSWWPGAESNHRHADFQSAALPTELPGHEEARV